MKCRAYAIALLLLTLTLTHAGSTAVFYRVVGATAEEISRIQANGVLVWSNTVLNTTCHIQTAETLLGDGNWSDRDHLLITSAVSAVKMFDPATPTGMRYIPAGIFAMGDSDGDHPHGVFGELNEDPVHTVQLNAFYISAQEISQGEWNRVRSWAVTNGYSIGCVGNGKQADHPAGSVCWHDAVLWCNARSEMEQLTPCYHTDAAQTNVYRSGALDLPTNSVKWSASGYRLPSEAEWEYAARGGQQNARFAFGSTIGHTQANYYSTNTYAYDHSATHGRHPDYDDTEPCTCPCGALQGNGHGLHEVAGNVHEWCWDYSDGTRSSCGTCSGSGQVTCPDCGGSGNTACMTCGGSGQISCDACGGSGTVEETCWVCSGFGENTCSTCWGLGWNNVTCSTCSGSGQNTCSSCGGSGTQACGICGGSGNQVCPTCGGSDPECSTCGGSGMVTCSSCGGSGAQTCSTCGGSGQETCATCAGMGFIEEPCSPCGGDGYVVCGTCSGNGFIYTACTTCGGIGSLSCLICGGTGNVPCTRCGAVGHETCSLCSGRGQLWSSEYYLQSEPSNPRGPATGPLRIARGGAWNSDANACRVSHRWEVAPTNVNPTIGFRPVRSAQ